MQRAEAAMQRGLAAAGRGEHAVALAAYVEAAELVPDANVPQKLAGEALEALERWIDAIARYQRYIEIKPDASGVAEVKARIEKIEREHVAVLDVQCDAGTFIAVDGRAAGAAPITPMRFVAPLSVKVTVTAAGREGWEQQVDLVPGVRSAVRCQLVAKQHPIPIEKPAEGKPWYRRWTIMGPAIGVAAVLVGTGLYLALSDDVPNTDGGSHSFP